MEEPPSYHSVQALNETDLPIEINSVERAVFCCLNYVKAPPSSVALLFATDEHVAELNRRYRGINAPTDVLTFADESRCSGDIAIAGPLALRQSSLRGICFEHELILLAIHGTLHLAGMDDEAEEDRREMVGAMYEVASLLDVPKGDDWGSLLHDEGHEL